VEALQQSATELQQSMDDMQRGVPPSTNSGPAELQPMRVADLRRRAAAAGASGVELDSTDDADSPKAALIELIVRHEAPSGEDGAETSLGMLQALRAGQPTEHRPEPTKSVQFLTPRSLAEVRTFRGEPAPASASTARSLGNDAAAGLRSAELEAEVAARSGQGLRPEEGQALQRTHEQQLQQLQFQQFQQLQHQQPQQQPQQQARRAECATTRSSMPSAEEPDPRHLRAPAVALGAHGFTASGSSPKR
jgi:hypothetical protein